MITSRKRLLWTMSLLLLSTVAADAGQYEVDQINAARARRGLYAYRLDASLDAVAFARASRMAASSHKGHVSGSYAPGRAEGVAWSSNSPAAVTRCCFAMSGTYRNVGSACVRGRDGYYCATVYR